MGAVFWGIWNCQTHFMPFPARFAGAAGIGWFWRQTKRPPPWAQCAGGVKIRFWIPISSRDGADIHFSILPQQNPCGPCGEKGSIYGQTYQHSAAGADPHGKTSHQKGRHRGQPKSQDNLGKWEAKVLEDKVDFRAALFPVPGRLGRPREARQSGQSFIFMAGRIRRALWNMPGVRRRPRPRHPSQRALRGIPAGSGHPFSRRFGGCAGCLSVSALQNGCPAYSSGRRIRGGGLCYALALRLRELGHPLPAGIIALSPWTDLTCSGASYEENLRRDPTLYSGSPFGIRPLLWRDGSGKPADLPGIRQFRGFPALAALCRDL